MHSHWLHMQISQQEAVGNSLQGSVSSSPVIFVCFFGGGGGIKSSENKLFRIETNQQKFVLFNSSKQHMC